MKMELAAQDVAVLRYEDGAGSTRHGRFEV